MSRPSNKPTQSLGRSFIDKYIIETGKANYTLMNPALDKQTKVLMDAREDGTLLDEPLAKPFIMRNIHESAAECLDWNAKRQAAITWQKADQYGRFIVYTPEEAVAILKALANDPEPLPKMSDLSPPIPQSLVDDNPEIVDFLSQ